MRNKIITVIILGFVLILLIETDVLNIISSFNIQGGLFFEESGENDLADLAEEEKKVNNSEIVLLMVGDIMLGRGVEYMVDKRGKGDFRFPFLKIAEEIGKSDILFGNLEGPISDNGLRVGSIYSFRFKPNAVNGLLYAGFDILSLANNHMFDYQGVALKDTMKILKENNIDYIGAGFNGEEAFSLKVKEIKGTKIGFLAYTDLGPENWKAGNEYAGISWIGHEDISEVTEKVKESKDIVDVLVISLHSGKEYSQDPMPFQIFFAENCIDSGADLVIGHHPHVVQKVEKYNNGWIAYSLGNFVFDQSFSKETMESIILKVTIEDKKIREVFSEKVKINEYFQPEIDH